MTSEDMASRAARHNEALNNAIATVCEIIDAVRPATLEDQLVHVESITAAMLLFVFSKHFPRKNYAAAAIKGIEILNEGLFERLKEKLQ